MEILGNLEFGGRRRLPVFLQTNLHMTAQQTGMVLDFLNAYAQKHALPFDGTKFSLTDISADNFRQDTQTASIDHAAFQKPPEAGKAYETTFAKMPLMLDEHTHNVFHPHYDAAKARNFSGKIFNADAPQMQTFPICRATKAACDETPPFAVRIPSAAIMPRKSSGLVSLRTRSTFSPFSTAAAARSAFR